MAIKFSCWFFPLNLLIFRLLITYFGTPQIAPDHAIFLNFPGEQTPKPPSNSVTTQCYGATYTPAHDVIIFLGN